MKSYSDIVGDGGSDILGQVIAQRQALSDSLAGVRHLLAVGSGKGGVGKSTFTVALARELRRRDKTVAIFDADLNGPCQAQLAGLRDRPWIPGPKGLLLPRREDGIGVVSLGSVLAETRPTELESLSQGDEFTWRATREFSLVGQLLTTVEWGELDVLLFDLPPGTERTVQFAQFLEPLRFVLVTLPSALSQGVVSRSVSALDEMDAKVLGHVDNMAGYYCRDCGEVRPLFPEREGQLDTRRLGSIPFDPALAAVSDRGWPLATVELPPSAALDAISSTAQEILEALENER